jgi:hypothetical protein
MKKELYDVYKEINEIKICLIILPFVFMLFYGLGLSLWKAVPIIFSGIMVALWRVQEKLDKLKS